ncbi:hypothetical protein CEXT_472821 [Caerostris extrusa]|uniref:Uncharacterized protein n=1 Tax=Caerostris extrusa TaxID=172846 RepID=A0AAV4X9A7_CAEEX|nr:hypothetical protein CEXT_472821 [Caerostris extrusa]
MGPQKESEVWWARGPSRTDRPLNKSTRGTPFHRGPLLTVKSERGREEGHENESDLCRKGRGRGRADDKGHLEHESRGGEGEVEEDPARAGPRVVWSRKIPPLPRCAPSRRPFGFKTCLGDG